MYICIYVYMYICIYVYMYICMYIYIYLYIYTRLKPAVELLTSTRPLARSCRIPQRPKSNPPIKVLNSPLSDRCMYLLTLNPTPLQPPGPLMTLGQLVPEFGCLLGSGHKSVASLSWSSCKEPSLSTPGKPHSVRGGC